MIREWTDLAIKFAQEPADFYSGCRKILRGRSFSIYDFSDDLRLSHAGFTKSKLTMLKRLYYDEDHTNAVGDLWKRRLEQDKYGSVGVSTYHHLTKADPNRRSKRASVMGPCLLGLSLTLINKGSLHVDAFYRTTELFKKFPADLVFIRDVLLPHFPHTSLAKVTFHFANITCHPMYFVTLLPSLEDPIQQLECLKTDKRFYDWTVKWTARYLCDEYSRGILKFSQALRTRKDALSRLRPKRLHQLQKYLRSNHPGYRNNYQGDEEDE